jgi:hypothetical protein
VLEIIVVVGFAHGSEVRHLGKPFFELIGVLVRGRDCAVPRLNQLVMLTGRKPRAEDR